MADWHDDLSSEHILLDEGRGQITGVIDWTDVEIGDPAVDFTGIYHHLGEAGTRQVLAHYPLPADEALIRRARFFAGCIGLFEMSHGQATGRADEWADGLRALALVGVDLSARAPA